MKTDDMKIAVIRADEATYMNNTLIVYYSLVKSTENLALEKET